MRKICFLSFTDYTPFVFLMAFDFVVLPLEEFCAYLFLLLSPLVMVRYGTEITQKEFYIQTQTQTVTQRK